MTELNLPTNKKQEKTIFHLDKNVLKCCDICNKCKPIENINRGPVEISSNALDLIHSDTWGKFRFPGVLGGQYYVTFADDFTRESEVFIMKAKTEVPKFFQLYKEKKERQLGRTIKTMRFDGRTESKSINFESIIQQISAPYTGTRMELLKD